MDKAKNSKACSGKKSGRPSRTSLRVVHVKPIDAGQLGSVCLGKRGRQDAEHDESSSKRRATAQKSIEDHLSKDAGDVVSLVDLFEDNTESSSDEEFFLSKLALDTKITSSDESDSDDDDDNCSDSDSDSDSDANDGSSDSDSDSNSGDKSDSTLPFEALNAGFTELDRLRKGMCKCLHGVTRLWMYIITNGLWLKELVGCKDTCAHRSIELADGSFVIAGLPVARLINECYSGLLAFYSERMQVCRLNRRQLIMPASWNTLDEKHATPKTLFQLVASAAAAEEHNTAVEVSNLQTTLEMMISGLDAALVLIQRLNTKTNACKVWRGRVKGVGRAVVTSNKTVKSPKLSVVFAPENATHYVRISLQSIVAIFTVDNPQ